MDNWLKILTFVVIGLNAFHSRASPAEANSWTNQDNNLTIAWIDKPPYATPPTNESLDHQARGLFRDVLLQILALGCSDYTGVKYNIRTLRAESEFGMIELLKQNKVHIAVPIFNQNNNEQYSQFLYLKVLAYPGTEYITTSDDETNGLIVVLDAVLKSWPLLAVTLILTAIAGIFMWALVSIELSHC